MCWPSVISAGLLRKKRKKAATKVKMPNEKAQSIFNAFSWSLCHLGPGKDQGETHEMTVEVSKTTFVAYQTPT